MGTRRGTRGGGGGVESRQVAYTGQAKERGREGNK